jgi:hypothetical protein
MKTGWRVSACLLWPIVVPRSDGGRDGEKATDPGFSGGGQISQLPVALAGIRRGSAVTGSQ